jgi:hypothetical protein
MGEAVYYLKARFKDSKALDKAMPKIQKFLTQTGEAQDYWQKNRSGDKTKFWAGFRKQFPLTTKFLGTAAGGDHNNNLAGVLSFGQDGELKVSDRDPAVLKYNEMTWHFANWDGLAIYLCTEYGALRAEWISDEYADPSDGIDI